MRVPSNCRREVRTGIHGKFECLFRRQHDHGFTPLVQQTGSQIPHRMPLACERGSELGCAETRCRQVADPIFRNWDCAALFAMFSGHDEDHHGCKRVICICVYNDPLHVISSMLRLPDQPFILERQSLLPVPRPCPCSDSVAV